MNWYIAKGIRVTEKALLERYPSGIPPFVDEVILRADHDAALRRAKAEGVRGLIGHEQLAIQILNALERGGHLVSGPDGEEIGMTILDEADKFLDARAAQIEEGE